MERKPDYIKPGGAPYYLNYPVDGFPQTNTCHVPYEMLVRDIRPSLSALDIDVHGFQMFRHQTLLQRLDFEDDRSVREKYYPETEALLQKALGATRVYIWEHTVPCPSCHPNSRVSALTQTSLAYEDRTARCAGHLGREFR